MGNQGFKPNPYIVARFFERLRKSKTGRLHKTRLQVATRLKWPDFTRYLDRLVALGVLELVEEDGETLVKPTKKGWELYYSLLGILTELAETQEES